MKEIITKIYNFEELTSEIKEIVIENLIKQRALWAYYYHFVENGIGNAGWGMYNDIDDNVMKCFYKFDDYITSETKGYRSRGYTKFYYTKEDENKMIEIFKIFALDFLKTFCNYWEYLETGEIYIDKYKE